MSDAEHISPKLGIAHLIERRQVASSCADKGGTPSGKTLASPPTTRLVTRLGPLICS